MRIATRAGMFAYGGKMEFLINPNFAYLLIVTAVMLALVSITLPGSSIPKIGMPLCLGAAWYELFHLDANPWALMIVALSPLTFFSAVHQPRMHFPLLVLTITMLAIGSFLLFVDQNGRPMVNHILAGIVSMFCGEFIWIAIERGENTRGLNLGNDPDSVVGLLGEVRVEIDATGLILAGGELWPARSKKPIPAGSLVRILRRDGFMLTVKKVEKINKE